MKIKAKTADGGQLLIETEPNEPTRPEKKEPENYRLLARIKTEDAALPDDWFAPAR